MKKAKKTQVKEIYQNIVKRVHGKRQKVAVLFGTQDNSGYIHIGWSRVNIVHGDKFDAQKGLKLAVERAKALRFVPAPHSIKKDLYAFQSRCFKYFKKAKVLDVTRVRIQPQPKQVELDPHVDL